MRAIDRRTWLLLPAGLLLAVAFLGPVGWLLMRAFTFPQPGFENFELLWQRLGGGRSRALVSGGLYAGTVVFLAIGTIAAYLPQHRL